MPTLMTLKDLQGYWKGCNQTKRTYYIVFIFFLFSYLQKDVYWQLRYCYDFSTNLIRLFEHCLKSFSYKKTIKPNNNFVNATEIEAGKPYIIRWNAQLPDYVENPVFTSVTISDSYAPITTQFADFVGTFSPIDIYTEEKTNLYLGADNNLYYPWDEEMTSFTINSCRAYFKLNSSLVAGDPIEPVIGINNFVLNFSGEETNFIDNSKLKIENGAGAWYDLSGRKLSRKPMVKGIYINNGHKVVVK